MKIKFYLKKIIEQEQNHKIFWAEVLDLFMISLFIGVLIVMVLTIDI
jgi:hypothetical protein